MKGIKSGVAPAGSLECQRNMMGLCAGKGRAGASKVQRSALHLEQSCNYWGKGMATCAVIGSGSRNWLRQQRATAGGVLDVYSDGGADGAGTPEASAEYGWIVAGTDEQSLETWAEGAARVGGLPEEMDSTRAELMESYAVLYKVSQWEDTMRIWVDNDNVVRGLEKRLDIERADAVWARSEDWAGSALEEGDSWRVQLGEGSDGDIWEAVDLLLERMQGKVEASWI